MLGLWDLQLFSSPCFVPLFSHCERISYYFIVPNLLGYEYCKIVALTSGTQP